jgi:iron complex transport system substrate-binding protein
MRVVSLLPSATEMLFEIGAGDLLVGRSHECDWPPQAVRAPVVTATSLTTVPETSGPPPASPTSTHTSTPTATPGAIDRAVRSAMAAKRPLYTLDRGLLAALRPDLVLTQDVCHVCSLDVDGVRSACEEIPGSAQVLSLNATTIEGVLDDMLTLASAVGRAQQGLASVTRLRGRMYRAQELVNPFTSIASCAVLEWTDPLFVAGHWTPQLVERAGAWHPLNPTVPVPGAGAAAGPIGLTQRRAGKGVVVPLEVLTASRPEVLIIAPCGRTLAQALDDARELARQGWWRTLPAVQRSRVAVLDGNASFSRPGPRLADTMEWLCAYLNDRPDAMPEGLAWAPLK